MTSERERAVNFEVKVTATGVVTDSTGNVVSEFPVETTVLVDEHGNLIEGN